jgi:phosphoglycerol geranylgeranyltransferase
VVLFPTSAGLLSGKADAIYFMVMMNSRDVRYLSREQMRGAPVIRKLGIEPISMGYVIVEPGMRVGKVGRAEVVPRAQPQTAAAYALAAQMLGMDCVYLEAGSGAPRPVPPRMVARVRATIEIPLIVGGGIRTPAAAAAAARAGGDIIVTGTVAERSADPTARLSKIVAAVKGA